MILVAEGCRKITQIEHDLAISPCTLARSVREHNADPEYPFRAKDTLMPRMMRSIS